MPDYVRKAMLVGPDGNPLQVSPANYLLSVATLASGYALAAAGQKTDGYSAADIGAVSAWLFNGTDFDRTRGQQNYVGVIPRGNYTALSQSTARQSYNARVLWASLTIFAAPNTTETLTLEVWTAGVPGGGGGTISAASITTVYGSSLQAPPYAVAIAVGAAATGTAYANFLAYSAVPVPPMWIVAVTPSGASTWNYQVDVSLMP